MGVWRLVQLCAVLALLLMAVFAGVLMAVPREPRSVPIVRTPESANMPMQSAPTPTPQTTAPTAEPATSVPATVPADISNGTPASTPQPPQQVDIGLLSPPTREPVRTGQPVDVRLLGRWDGSSQRYSAVAAWSNYAVIGHVLDGGGVHIIDISDSANPRLLSTWGTGDSWDIDIKDGYVYVGAESGSGLHVLDIHDPANPVRVAHLGSHNGGLDAFHTVTIDGNYLYIADLRSNAIPVFDISNPHEPKPVQTIYVPYMPEESGRIHEVTVRNGRLFAATFFCSGGVHMFDVSKVEEAVNYLGGFISGCHAHSTAVTDDGRYVAVAHERERGPVDIWDVANPKEPRLVKKLHPVELGFDSYGAHIPVIVGNRMYVAWSNAGLKVFDITDMTSPVLIGEFDTTDGVKERLWNDGNWDVYPHLGADKVIVSDWDTGLSILDTSNVRLAASAPTQSLQPKAAMSTNETVNTAQTPPGMSARYALCLIVAESDKETRNTGGQFA